MTTTGRQTLAYLQSAGTFSVSPGLATGAALRDCRSRWTSTATVFLTSWSVIRPAALSLCSSTTKRTRSPKPNRLGAGTGLSEVSQSATGAAVNSLDQPVSVAAGNFTGDGRNDLRGGRPRRSLLYRPAQRRQRRLRQPGVGVDHHQCRVRRQQRRRPRRRRILPRTW